jgi:hypothetical protein
MVEGPGMKVVVPRHVVANTLEHLKADGAHSREAVVLWLGRREPTRVIVDRALRPDQEAHSHIFRIPPMSMTKIMSQLRGEGLMIGVQIHTHPEEAFHSAADDAWAIVRHVGALSIVLPYFAQKSTVDSFFDNAATYVVVPDGSWKLVTAIEDHLELSP